MTAPAPAPTRAKRPKRRRQPVFLRVTPEGAFVPADSYSRAVLREREYRAGLTVRAELSVARSQGFNRLVHAIGRLVVENIEGFEQLDAHAAIKRLQLESGLLCDEIACQLPGFGMVIQRVPASLSFSDTDETEFRAFARGICRHIAERYWPTLEAEQIEQMAELFIGEGS